MGLRRHISYQWQLFIPLVGTLWLTIIGMALWQSYNEREYRLGLLREQLKLIGERIVDAYENEYNPQRFYNFVSRYYVADPLYDQIRISVYEDNKLIYSVGNVISLSEVDSDKAEGFIHGSESENDDDVKKPHTAGYLQSASRKITNSDFFYWNSHSSDGRMQVYTVLPFNEGINAIGIVDPSIWIVLFGAAAILTVIAYFSTRYFGRNISNLRTLALNAATDPNFIPALDYPNDELGDITHQIIHMYNERSKAVLKLKREHQVALHAMEEKARMKRQLTNNINHELKTPIGVIKGYLDTILENPDMDPASRDHFLRKMLEHANRLVNLITDVSAMTRLEEGSSLVSTEELDYHDVVYTVCSDLEESGALGEMEFVYDVPTGCLIMGNYNLLTGMLINLAKNAAAYSKGTECGVRLDGEDDKFYHFTFFDNGVGVKEEHLPHLFERFYRVDTGRSRKSGGTGLGLPIVQNTILAHGGSIEVLNGDNGGLWFRYTLPKIKTK